MAMSDTDLHTTFLASATSGARLAVSEALRSLVDRPLHVHRLASVLGLWKMNHLFNYVPRVRLHTAS